MNALKVFVFPNEDREGGLLAPASMAWNLLSMGGPAVGKAWPPEGEGQIAAFLPRIRVFPSVKVWEGVGLLTAAREEAGN